VALEATPPGSKVRVENVTSLEALVEILADPTVVVDAVDIGDLANSRICEQGFEWELKGLGGPPMMFTTDSTGRAWLFVGTDSGFEPRSAVYYTRFRALFEPMSRRRPRERC
jgi:hypothetical protein